MRRLLIVVASLSLGLAGVANVAFAQDSSTSGLTTNADGSHVSSTAGVNPTANGGGGTIVYGDINTGQGNTVLAPPSIVTTTAPAPAPVEVAPEPVYEEPVYEEPVDTAVSTEAVASESDLDADNIADELEWDLGLDPTIADVDGDGVADGDEINIYGTDPLVWDSDGDGIADGEELFGIQTDPLVWDDFSDDGVETVAQQAAEEVQPFQELTTELVQQLNQGTDEDLTAANGDASSLGSGSASSAPGTITRGSKGTGASILGPDGTYRVTENAPADVSITGDTDVLSPPVTAPTDSSSTTCAGYGSWYDAQVAYEAAGLTNADPAMVSSLDPDYDGIACEEGM